VLVTAVTVAVGDLDMPSSCLTPLAAAPPIAAEHSQFERFSRVRFRDVLL